MTYYILDGKTPVPEPDIRKWAEWLSTADRVVNQTTGIVKLAGTPVGDVQVSTVFLGVDHSFSGGPPLLFETMVFGGVLDQETDRCTSWEAAEKMHERMCDRVKCATEHHS